MSSLVSGQVQEQNHDGESVQGENSSASIDAREVDLTSNDPTGLDFARDHFTRAIVGETERLHRRGTSRIERFDGLRVGESRIHRCSLATLL